MEVTYLLPTHLLLTKNYFNRTILFLICIHFIGCDYGDGKLKVWNSSKDSIAFIVPSEPNYFPTSDAKEADRLFNPDFLNSYAKYSPEDMSFGGVYFIAKDSMERMVTFNMHWEDVINATPEKRLEIYFFPTHIMTSGKYKWKDIFDKRMYVDKQRLSEEELEKADWNIYYKGENPSVKEDN